MARSALDLGIVDVDRHIVYRDLFIVPPGIRSRFYYVQTDVLFDDGTLLTVTD